MKISVVSFLDGLVAGLSREKEMMCPLGKTSRNIEWTFEILAVKI